MISTCSFIPRGCMQENPLQYELHPEELDEIIKRQAQMSLEEAKETVDKAINPSNNENNNNSTDEKKSNKSSGNIIMDDSEGDNSGSSDEELVDNDVFGNEPMNPKESQLLKELGMETYDEEPEGAELFLGGQSLAVFESNTEDPYITVPDEEDEISDEEDITINKNDALIICGRSEARREDSGEPQSTIELHIYDPNKGSLFVHHDFPIPSFPLTTQWINLDPRANNNNNNNNNNNTNGNGNNNNNSDMGSFLAIGQMSGEAGIEIWNLDVLDVLEPVAVLGGVDSDATNAAAKNKSKASSKSKKSSKQTPIFRTGSHTESVLSLSWHEKYRNRLASGSADKSIKLWDITTQQCVSTFNNIHSAPVQSLQFNYFEPQILLTGGYDSIVNLIDVRSGKIGKKWQLSSEIEQLRWNPHNGNLFLVSMSDGTIQLFDVSRGDNNRSIFTLGAHSGECTSISWNSIIPTVFASAGVDGIVKIWNCTSNNNNSVEPVLVGSKEMKIGKVMSMSYDNNDPWLLVAGGDKDKLGVWDSAENKTIETKLNIELRNLNKLKHISITPDIKTDENNNNNNNNNKSPNSNTTNNGNINNNNNSNNNNNGSNDDDMNIEVNNTTVSSNNPSNQEDKNKEKKKKAKKNKNKNKIATSQ